MKKILYSSPKENIELSYPNWLDPFIKKIWRLLKVKTVKLNNGADIKEIWIDEVNEII